MPTAASISSTRAAIAVLSAPLSASGNPTLRATDRCGSRWNAWKMNPMRARRKRVRPASSSPAMSWPATTMRPESGTSRPAMRLSSVDLPAPDSPITAMYSPAASCSDTSWSTTRERAPTNDLLTRSTASMPSVRTSEPVRHAQVGRVLHEEVALRLDATRQSARRDAENVALGVQHRAEDAQVQPHAEVLVDRDAQAAAQRRRELGLVIEPRSVRAEARRADRHAEVRNDVGVLCVRITDGATELQILHVHVEWVEAVDLRALTHIQHLVVTPPFRSGIDDDSEVGAGIEIAIAAVGGILELAAGHVADERRELEVVVLPRFIGGLHGQRQAQQRRGCGRSRAYPPQEFRLAHLVYSSPLAATLTR